MLKKLLLVALLKAQVYPERYGEHNVVIYHA